jgi:hypothetical protein
MPLEFRHYDFGVQPHERAAFHERLLTDPEWSGKDIGRLEEELGVALDHLMGSLATRMFFDGRIGDLQVVCIDAGEFDGCGTPTPASVVATSGFTPDKRKAWMERLQSAEDRPIAFEIVDPTAWTDYEGTTKVAYIGFDGAEYQLIRWGRPFEHPTASGETITAFAIDSWSAWDDNAEKKKYSAAERAHLAATASDMIMNVQENTPQAVADVLAVISWLYDSNEGFQGKIADSKKKERKDVTGQEIISYVAESLSFNEEADTQAIKDMTDPTQQLLVKHWFITEGSRAVYRDKKFDVAGQGIQERLAAKVAETANASTWPVAKMRQYLADRLDRAVKYHESFAREHYGEASLKEVEVYSSVHAFTDIPELNDNNREIELPSAVAIKENPPPEELVESLRELERLEEEIEEADADGTETMNILARRLQYKIEIDHGKYIEDLKTAAVRAKERVYRKTVFDAKYAFRPRLIEGILLARELVRKADEG